MEEFLVGIYITSNSDEKSIINKFNYITLVMGFFISRCKLKNKPINLLDLMDCRRVDPQLLWQSYDKPYRTAQSYDEIHDQ